MRANDKKHNSYQQMTPPMEEFGLGIQVFKIQSNKVTDDDRLKQRKIMKNIQNPIFSKPNVLTLKKPHVLPSLSMQKKLVSTYQNESVKQRKSTVQKKKISYQPDTIKQFEEKRNIFEKKPTLTHQSAKNVQAETLPPPIKQKQIIQTNFRKSLNELQSFTQKLQEAELENLKQIKKLKKQKQNVQELLNWHLKCKQDKKLLVDVIVDRSLPYFSQETTQYDEFNISNYVDNQFKFKYYDVVENMDY